MSNFMKAYWLTLLLFAFIMFVLAMIYIYVNDIIYETNLYVTIIWAAKEIFKWFLFNSFISIVIGMPYYFILNTLTKFNYFCAVMMGVLAGLVNYGVLLFLSGIDYASQWGWFVGFGTIFGLILAAIQYYYNKKTIMY